MCWVLVGNEPVQVLKLVLISFTSLRNFFCLDSKFKPIIYCQFTDFDVTKSHSQQNFVEESGRKFIYAYAMKSFHRAT